MRTVQGEVERALNAMTGEENRVTASGRTDAGVHAICQTAHFDTSKTWDAAKFVGGLNSYLPRDIRILSAYEVPDGFHARYSAKCKTYEYVMYRSDRERAVYLERAARIPEGADTGKMRRAAGYFIGTHDFASFCAADADTKTSVRTVTRSDISLRDGLIVFTVTSDGFLYNMVRIMTGLLIRIATGGEPEYAVSEVIAARDRTLARDTAPACGLYLKKVYY